LMWLFKVTIQSSNAWVDRLLLVMGGYIAGTSLTGAPLIVAVFMRNIDIQQLRNTLLTLWFVLVSIKMATFKSFGVGLQLDSALMLLPVAAIGHFLGLKMHNRIMRNDQQFKRIIGGTLMLVCSLGLWKALT